MLFTSAGFMFLFLPVALAAFYLTPVRFRRYLLLAVSLAFYLLANLRTPLAIPLLPAVAVGTHFLGKWAAKSERASIISAVSCGGFVAVFLVLRVVSDNVASAYFPLGAAIWLLACGSYVIDVARRDAEPAGLFDTLLYICFFPVMGAGPVIKYKDFVRYCADMQFTVNNFAYGVKMFALGAVERLAVAAVLLEGYKRIIETGNNVPDLTFGIIASVFIFFSMYFAFAGWTDMGVGVAAMFGIRLERDCEGALWACSPARYFSRFLKGLSGWIDDYVVRPALGLCHLAGSAWGEALAAALTVLCMALWINTSVAMLCMGVIVAIIVLVLNITGAEQLMNDVKATRIIGFFLTFVSVSLFWTAGAADSLGSFLTLLNEVSFTARDYHIYYVYIVMAGRKYLITAIAALILAPLTCFGRRITDKLSDKLAGALEACATIALLVAFVFTIVYCMPQFPQYALRAFEYFIF